MKVTVLIENRSGTTLPNLVAEWGLALYITWNGKTILFDTGASGTFASNAQELSLGLTDIDAAVLSHHHFDHGGGLRRLFETNADTVIHLAEPPDGECFTKLLFVVKKYVGLDNALFSDYHGRFKFVKETTEILPGVFIFPTIRGEYPRPIGNKRLFLKRDGEWVTDDFSHELVMAIMDGDRLVIFTGCSHNGILNMVDTVAREFKGIPIKAVVGGFHLIASPPFNAMAGSKRDVEALGKQILEYPVEHTYTGHCTGAKAFAVLKGVMGERISDIATGTSFEI